MEYVVTKNVTLFQIAEREQKTSIFSFHSRIKRTCFYHHCMGSACLCRFHLVLVFLLATKATSSVSGEFGTTRRDELKLGLNKIAKCVVVLSQELYLDLYIFLQQRYVLCVQFYDLSSEFQDSLYFELEKTLPTTPNRCVNKLETSCL